MPCFSIVVPTYERPESLRRLLSSLAALDYPCEDFEVIVIADGEGQLLEDVLEPFREHLALVFERVSHRGCGPARQAGVERARGDYLVFTDDDCRPEKDWLRAFEARIAEAPGCAVGGRVRNGLPTNACSSASQALMSYLYEVKNVDHDDAHFFTTNNVALPRAALHEIGGVDPHWSISGGEDRDLWERWRASGRRMVYAPDAVVHHEHALTLRSLWRQHYHYGRGAYVFHSGSHAPGRRRIRFETPAFYLKLPLHAWRETSGGRAWHCAALLMLTQVANTAGWLREFVRRAVNGRPDRGSLHAG